MSDDVFSSSDSARHARPLHYARQVTFEEPLALELSGTLPAVTVVYETYGQLNAQRDNAILICHALSGDSHVARHDPEDDPGWWDIFVGPGRAIDTDRYFVICPNILGSCRGTTGPHTVNPATGKPYGADFPVVTVGDMVGVQARLVGHLGIESLLAVVGGSLGGQQALAWATQFPERVRGCAAIATSARLTCQALAFDVVGRNAIKRDPNFKDGQYYGRRASPAVGLALARMLGHITYLSREAMTEKFEPNRTVPRGIATDFEKKFSVGSYLAYQGSKFVERFDANSYIALSMAMDLFDLGASHGKLVAALARSRCRWLVLSFTSDWLFPPFQSRELVDALLASNKPVSYCNVRSACGHDAFLLEDELPVYGALTAGFLSNLRGEAPAQGPSAGDAASDPTSIFHGERLDYGLLMKLIPPGASVLDLGCGTGGLLALLKKRGHPRLTGAEIDEEAVVACVQHGLDVVQIDLNEGLSSFQDGQFDFVVLSQTLQTITGTERVIDEMLRVGRNCIVSFPNFAYRKMRQMLAAEGRSPKAGGLYQYEWYDTPNRRFPSISDFVDFCRRKSIRILREVYLDTETQRQVNEDPNLNADVAIIVLSR
ncbi:MAG: homoserine O-acetyltransferase [Planctomycetota bacterium]